MARSSRILVVGTTPDYIEWLRRVAPGEVLFLTDAAFREAATEPEPAREDEVAGDLTDFERIHAAVLNHLDRHRMRIEGVACFDCESLELAAWLAGQWGMPFPSLEAVRLCRDKQQAKECWRAAGVATAHAVVVDSPAGLRAFFEQLRQPLIIKPLNGSGSELVFLCQTPEECDRDFAQLSEGLAGRIGSRMYGGLKDRPLQALAEEYLEGPEYSCDFIIQGGRIAILRFTRKLPFAGGPPGTTRAYAPADYFHDEAPALEAVRTAMQAGARALGLDKTICMADFIVRGDRIMLLEMTPRPGGDCLPHLTLAGAGVDMLRFTVDFACHPVINGVKAPFTQPYVGLRLFASRPGVIERLDTGALSSDRRTRHTHLLRQPGHRVTLPPEDYESWLLGHVIFMPGPGRTIASQCDELAGKLAVAMSET